MDGAVRRGFVEPARGGRAASTLARPGEKGSGRGRAPEERAVDVEGDGQARGGAGAALGGRVRVEVNSCVGSRTCSRMASTARPRSVQLPAASQLAVGRSRSFSSGTSSTDAIRSRVRSSRPRSSPNSFAAFSSQRPCVRRSAGAPSPIGQRTAAAASLAASKIVVDKAREPATVRASRPAAPPRPGYTGRDPADRR